LPAPTSVGLPAHVDARLCALAKRSCASSLWPGLLWPGLLGPGLLGPGLLGL